MHECEVEDIVRWRHKHRRPWNNHVDRMARDGIPQTRRFLYRNTFKEVDKVVGLQLKVRKNRPKAYKYVEEEEALK